MRDLILVSVLRLGGRSGGLEGWRVEWVNG